MTTCQPLQGARRQQRRSANDSAAGKKGPQPTEVGAGDILQPRASIEDGWGHEA